VGRAWSGAAPQVRAGVARCLLWGVGQDRDALYAGACGGPDTAVAHAFPVQHLRCPPGQSDMRLHHEV